MICMPQEIEKEKERVKIGGWESEGKGRERERERKQECKDRDINPNLDDLPQESKYKVRSSLHDVLGSNVDDVASDRASRVES